MNIESPALIQTAKEIAATTRTGALEICAGFLGLLWAVSTGMHGWPAESLSNLPFLWPVNLVTLLWLAIASVWVLFDSRTRSRLIAALPPEPVWAYMAVCLLSVATADHPSRSVVAAMKVVLTFIGTYTLLTIGLQTQRDIKRLLLLLSLAVSGLVVLALGQKLSGRPAIGLHGTELKFGTYLAMLTPLAWTHLVGQRVIWMKLWAAMLVCCALLACDSAWAFAAIALGVCLAGLVRADTRKWFLVVAVLSVLGCGLFAKWGYLHNLQADARLKEVDRVDLRQRYIEWQAQINLLKDRAVMGTGIGCLNDHRSEYYGQLPKRNTIQPFDQNGWLAAASETGLLGLACLSLIFAKYLTQCYRHHHLLVVGAVLAGLAGAAIGNVASAIHYNGILTIFAGLLAIADRGIALGGDSHA